MIAKCVEHFKANQSAIHSIEFCKANKIKVLRKVVGKTIIDTIRSQQIRESCCIQPINDWVDRRRREWDQHIIRMDAERLVKISRDSIPV